MITAEFSFPSIFLIRFLFISISLVPWSGTSLAQLSSVEMTEEQALAHIKAQLEQEHSEEALRLIERFLDQSDPLAFIDRFTFLHAVALQARGQPHHAITILEQFLEEHPASPLLHDARLTLGTLYIESRRPDRAIPILSRALDLAANEPARVEALHRLCIAYELNGEHLRAIQTALVHVDQVGEDERRELRDFIQRLILQKMNERLLSRVFEIFSTGYPGDLALIRLIELHTAQDDEVLAQRDILAFLHRFPEHPYAQTAGALLQNVIAKIKAHRHVIAAALPFSGNMKPFGIEAFNGIRLALEEKGGFLGSNAVGLVVKDSVLPSAQFRREFSQLLDEFAPLALIGPLLAREVQLLADMPDLAGVPFITPTATLPNVNQFGQYWFSTAMTPHLQVKRIVEYAMQHFGYTRFCILAPHTPHGKRLTRIFQHTVTENGGEVVATEMYQPGTTDASPQITRIKDTGASFDGETLPPAAEEPATSENTSVREGEEDEDALPRYIPGFDALFLPGHPTDVAFLAAQLAFFDVNVPLLGTNGWNHPNLLKWGRSSIEGGLFGDALFLQTDDPEIQRFITTYRERFQTDPSIFAAQAYDAMHVILDTIRHGAATGSEVRRQLVVRHDVPTLGGLGKFDEGGILTRKVSMIQIRNGRFIQLD